MIAESEMCGDLRMRAFTSLAILVAVALVHGPNVARRTRRSKVKRPPGMGSIATTS